MFDRCVIVGSGSSILEGVYQGLWDILQKEITFSINDNIRFFLSTVAMFGDWTCYKSRYSYFASHPLTIGKFSCEFNHPEFDCPTHKGLILLQSSGHYHGKDSFTKGIYSAVLTGCFTLTLAIQLGFKQIFLLGFDEREINGLTHWYQREEGAGIFLDCDGKPITGVGKDERGNYKTSVYNSSSKDINALWLPFVDELATTQIFNVSPLSRIMMFDKIDYETFFNMLKSESIQTSQDDIRKKIRKILNPYNKVTNERI